MHQSFFQVLGISLPPAVDFLLKKFITQKFENFDPPFLIDKNSYFLLFCSHRMQKYHFYLCDKNEIDRRNRKEAVSKTVIGVIYFETDFSVRFLTLLKAVRSRML